MKINNPFSNKKEDSNKNKKLASDIIRVKVNRLINGTAVEIANFEADIIRDDNNNTVIDKEDISFREEPPGIQDVLITDILYKLESRNLSVEEQKRKIKDTIQKQEKILKNIKNGYITVLNKETKEEEKVKVNKITEKSKLRLYKVVQYTLENRKGEGYFEHIELDGTRTLTYLVMDGDLIPYWHKTPTSEGEPLSLIPDISQRKKFYKEGREEVVNDFKELKDPLTANWFGIIKLTIIALLILGNLFGLVQNLKMADKNYDNTIMPQLKELQVENEKIKTECTRMLQTQIENNNELIDYAKIKLEAEKLELQERKVNLNNVSI